MNNIVVFSHKITAIVILLLAPIVVAQNRHVESFNVGSDVLVSVNTSHTDVVFETWNKDRVEVEAYIEGDKLSEKELATDPSIVISGIDEIRHMEKNLFEPDTLRG